MEKITTNKSKNKKSKKPIKRIRPIKPIVDSVALESLPLPQPPLINEALEEGRGIKNKELMIAEKDKINKKHLRELTNLLNKKIKKIEKYRWVLDKDSNKPFWITERKERKILN